MSKRTGCGARARSSACSTSMSCPSGAIARIRLDPPQRRYRLCSTISKTTMGHGRPTIASRLSGRLMNWAAARRDDYRPSDCDRHAPPIGERSGARAASLTDEEIKEPYGKRRTNARRVRRDGEGRPPDRSARDKIANMRGPTSTGRRVGPFQRAPRVEKRWRRPSRCQTRRPPY